MSNTEHVDDDHLSEEHHEYVDDHPDFISVDSRDDHHCNMHLPLSLPSPLIIKPYVIEGWSLISQYRKQVTTTQTKKVTEKVTEKEKETETETEKSMEGNKMSLETVSSELADQIVPMLSRERIMFRVGIFLLFGGFVFQLAVGIVTLYTQSIMMGNAVLLGFCSIIYIVPFYKWPPVGTTSYWAELLAKYFSYRVIIESEVELKQMSKRPVIYLLGTSCDYEWSVAGTIQVLLHRCLTGQHLCMLVSPVLMIIPVFNIILQRLGAMKENSEVFHQILNSDKDIIVPIKGSFSDSSLSLSLSLSDKKTLIQFAVTHNAIIVPCYCFGGHNIFEASPWVPYRISLLTVIGRPITLPLIFSPLSLSLSTNEKERERKVRESEILNRERMIEEREEDLLKKEEEREKWLEEREKNPQELNKEKEREKEEEKESIEKERELIEKEKEEIEREREKVKAEALGETEREERERESKGETYMAVEDALRHIFTTYKHLYTTTWKDRELHII